MEQNANAEKQARYRKKELLKRQADNLMAKWQMDLPFRDGHKKSFQEMQQLINKAIELPSAWTDEDYQIAEVKLAHLHAELTLSVDQISNDIHESSNFSEKFRTAPDLKKITDDLERSIKNTTELAAHIVSALNLSSCNEAEKATALMEAMRFVGRMIVLDHRNIPYSDATAVCLATIGPQYVRPDWFPEKFASAVSKQIDRDRSKEVAKHLSKGTPW